MKHQVVNFGEQHSMLQLINPNIITENRNILWFNTGIWGSSQDNAMPEFLADLVNSSSSIHSNLCQLKFTQIQGQNLELQDSTNARAGELTAFIDKRNLSGDNLKAVYSKCAKDFSIFEACCLQVLYDKTGRIANLYHVPLENVRMEVPNQYSQVENFYVSRYWADISNVRYKKKTPYNSAVRVHTFAPDQYKEYPVQMMYISAYNPTTFYSIPMYTSAINWILIDNMISNFHISNLKTNFFIAGMLTQQGNPTPEEMADFIDDFKELYQGTGNAQQNQQKMIFSWVDSMKDSKPEFTPFQSEKNDNLFKDLLDKAEAKIVFGHCAYPEIAGKTDKIASLGGEGNALYVGLQSFTQLVSENMKDIILSAFNRCLEVNELPNVTCVTNGIRTTQPKPEITDLSLEERRMMIYGLSTEKTTQNTPADTAVNQTPNV